MQIDWISGFVETPPELYPDYDTGHILKIDRHGSVSSESTIGLNVSTPDTDPSSSRNFHVWSRNHGNLYLSGNPIKLLQDHNLWGSTDTLGLFLTAGIFVRQHVGLFPGPTTWKACQFAGPRYTRIDITRSYRFDNEQLAASFIRDSIGSARTRHGSPTMHGSETAYFGKHSRRWSMKVYRKQPEFLLTMKDRFGRFSPKYNKDLQEWSEGVVRFELVLRGPEINERYKEFDFNQSETLNHVWHDKFNTIQFNQNTTMAKQTSIAENNLTNMQKGIISMWREGFDLRSIHSKTAFYRHRKIILEKVGVDILTAPQNDTETTSPVAMLNDNGWDPEPLTGQLVEPDDQLKLDYPLSS